MADEERAADSPWCWEPLVRLGPVRFGEDIDSLMLRLSLECEETRTDDDGEWRWYAVSGAGVSLHTLNGIVVSASCDDLAFNGTSLSGLTESEVRAVFHPCEVIRGTYPSDTTLEVPALKCLLTLDEETGLVAAVGVGSLTD